MSPRRSRLPLGTRSALLFSALLFAATGNAVLTATSETSTLAVKGTLDESARVAAYDILVRPSGARLPLEESRNLIQPGFLNAVAGGITTDQWHRIQQIPGVAVAAPIALLGYTAPAVEVPADVPGLTGLTAPVLLRAQSTWGYDNGASSLESVPTYYYITPFPVRFEFVDPTVSANRDRHSAFVEQLPDGSTRRLEVFGSLPRWTYQEGLPDVVVVSTAQRKKGTRLIGTYVDFPFLVAAIDPDAEAKLSGLDTAVVDGSYFGARNSPPAGEVRTFHFADGQDDPRVPIPVLVASRPGVAFTSRTRYTTVATDDPLGAARSLLRNRPLPALAESPLATFATDQDAAYREFVNGMATPSDEGSYMTRSTLRYLRTGPTEVVDATDGRLAARTLPRDPNAWGSPGSSGDVTGGVILPGGDDTGFRGLTSYLSDFQSPPPALVRVGVFDATRLRGNGSLDGVPLGCFGFRGPRGADDASRRALGDRGWYPSANLGGYVQPPPLMLTTLDYLPLFADPGRWFQSAPGGISRFGATPIAGDPLSAIRVKVAGVQGVGDLDRERVRAVAEDIATRTGLEVDITLGSSPGRQTIAIPAGEHGRPALDISEWWVTKGVAVTLVEAADRKSILLGWLSLLTTALVVGNAVLASVRARRRDIGTVLALGWSRGQVFGHVLAPVLLTALTAGVAAAVLALAVRAMLGLAVSVPEVLPAIPTALLVALVAASGPALVASRLDPVTALKPPVAAGAPRRCVRSVAGLGWRSVRATPGRAVLAAAGVTVATTAVAAILAIQAEFNGRAVGTLLGDAVTIQVRAPDVAAAVLGFLLAGLGLFHLMATEVRERAMELALLRAVGWHRSTVLLVLVTQATLVGLAGAATGGAAALVVLAATFGQVTASMAWGVGGAVVAAVPLAVAVTWLAWAFHRRLPIGELVAAE
jgi:cell division protein FtsX